MGCKKNSPCSCCGEESCSCGAVGDISLVPMSKGAKKLAYPKTQEDLNRVKRQPKDRYPRAGVEVQF